MRYGTKGKYKDMPGTFRAARGNVQAKFITKIRLTPEPGGLVVHETEPGDVFHVDKTYCDDGPTYLFLRGYGWARQEQNKVNFFTEVQDGIQD